MSEGPCKNGFRLKLLRARRSLPIKRGHFCKSKRSVAMHRHRPGYIFGVHNWACRVTIQDVNYLFRQFSLPNMEFFAMIKNLMKRNGPRAHQGPRHALTHSALASPGETSTHCHSPPIPKEGLNCIFLDALAPISRRSEDYPPQREATMICIWPSRECRSEFLGISLVHGFRLFPCSHRHPIQNCGNLCPCTKRAEW